MRKRVTDKICSPFLSSAVTVEISNMPLKAAQINPTELTFTLDREVQDA